MVKSLSVHVFVPWTILVPLNRVSHRNAKICWGNSSYTKALSGIVPLAIDAKLEVVSHIA